MHAAAAAGAAAGATAAGALPCSACLDPVWVLAKRDSCLAVAPPAAAGPLPALGVLPPEPAGGCCRALTRLLKRDSGRLPAAVGVLWPLPAALLPPPRPLRVRARWCASACAALPVGPTLFIRLRAPPKSPKGWAVTTAAATSSELTISLASRRSQPSPALGTTGAALATAQIAVHRSRGGAAGRKPFNAPVASQTHITALGPLGRVGRVASPTQESLHAASTTAPP